MTDKEQIAKLKAENKQLHDSFLNGLRFENELLEHINYLEDYIEHLQKELLLPYLKSVKQGANRLIKEMQK